jgi:hypothetical protein
LDLSERRSWRPVDFIVRFFETQTMKKETIYSLREYYELPDYVPDAKIDTELTGSMGEAIVNIVAAKKNFKIALCKSLPVFFKKYIKT